MKIYVVGRRLLVPSVKRFVPPPLPLPLAFSLFLSLSTILTIILSSFLLQEVSMLEIAGHLEAFHSVDTSKIDWSKSLSSQAAVASATPTLSGSCEAQQNFSCACGANFQFQDDLQVHQVQKLFILILMEKMTALFSLSLSLPPSLPPSLSPSPSLPPSFLFAAD